MTFTRSQISALNALKGSSQTFKLEAGYHAGHDGLFVIGEDKRAWFITTNGSTHVLANWPPLPEAEVAVAG